MARHPAALAGIPAAQTVAAASACAFAGGALLSQTVIVPIWRAMPPATFLQHFPRYGPTTGLTVFPFEVAAMLTLGAATWRAWRRRSPRRAYWAAASACMAGTFVLLVYFVPHNLALLDPAFPVGSVPGALADWNRWNWARAGLGIASACLAVAAGTARPPQAVTNPPSEKAHR